MDTSHELLLITRLKTLNKGNQALSAAWLSVLQRAFPGAAVRVLERRPNHLVQYTLRDLAGQRDPWSSFERLAERLARLAPGPEYAGAPERPKIELDETLPPRGRLVALRQRLNLRGRIAALGRYVSDYKRRLSAMQRAQMVVINPAGEFFPREPAAAFYHLLDAHVAQKLGRPTAMVNHTMDISDPTLRALIPRIYRTLHLVGFRDDKSVAAFQAMGGDPHNVLVTPDLALTTELASARPRRPGTVAVAINVPEAEANGYLASWTRVIELLRGSGARVALVSNELPVDEGFYDRLRQRFSDITLEGRGLDHQHYGELLGSFDTVVSSRMHTLVLAMCAGTPVAAVEGASFKITGLLQELGIAQPVVQPRGTEWPVAVVEQVEQLRRERDAASRDVTQRISAVRERIVSMLVPRLQSVVKPAA